MTMWASLTINGSCSAFPEKCSSFPFCTTWPFCRDLVFERSLGLLSGHKYFCVYLNHLYHYDFFELLLLDFISFSEVYLSLRFTFLISISPHDLQSQTVKRFKTDYIVVTRTKNHYSIVENDFSTSGDDPLRRHSPLPLNSPLPQPHQPGW